MADFGKTTVSGNWGYGNAGIGVSRTSISYSPDYNGTVTSISVYIERNSGSDPFNLKAALYKDIGGGIATAILVTSGTLANVPAVAGWRTVTVTPASIYAANNYFFSIEPDVTIDTDYATGADSDYLYTAYSTFPPDPHGTPDGTDTGRNVSFYGSYTPTMSDLVSKIFNVSYAAISKIYTVSPSLISNIYGVPGFGYGNLHVDGTQLKDEYGNAVIIRCAEYGAAYWYHDYNGSSEDAVVQAQFDYMKNWGMNCVRLNIACSDLEAEGLDVPPVLLRLDQVLNWALDAGLYVILNAWGAYGGAPNGYDQMDVSHYFKDNYANGIWWFSEWYSWWQTLATRYKGHGIIYDFYNEPLYWDYADHQTRIRQCIDNIVAIDSSAISMVECSSDASWAGQHLLFEQTYPISRNNVIFSYHYYGYFMYPDNSELAIRSGLTGNYAAWCLANGRCLVNGEYGGNTTGSPYVQWDLDWVLNYLTVSDADGYSGYTAHSFEASPWSPLIADWSGTPTNYGVVVRDYYLNH